MLGTLPNHRTGKEGLATLELVDAGHSFLAKMPDHLGIDGELYLCPLSAQAPEPGDTAPRSNPH